MSWSGFLDLTRLESLTGAGRAGQLGRWCTNPAVYGAIRWLLGRSSRGAGQAVGMNSRVHPTYKTRYRVDNWPEYERSLVRRGDITLWLSPDAIESWKAVPSGQRGGQKRFSDTAIETALMLRLLFHLPLRQTEGFLRSLFELMGADLDVPDHTTLSRRSQQLDIKLRRAPTSGAIHLIVDSTGLSIVGEGEWAAAKHGGKGKRGWKKLHLGVPPTTRLRSTMPPPHAAPRSSFHQRRPRLCLDTDRGQQRAIARSRE